jgi:hypothetical protein
MRGELQLAEDANQAGIKREPFVEFCLVLIFVVEFMQQRPQHINVSSRGEA